MESRQVVGLTGALVLFVGVFTPIVSIPTIGYINYFQNEKTCSVEPGGKPCDHCAMCSSRGF